ncbi:MAG: glycine--tRNA ligase subunit beta [Gammaproteobacteria bacterium RIFCSPHIGHO2_12_FULL_38_14]|nr:MAG: glycine--tRNA ligase subunit beta [Gammaproteobacteria bacterium RIFCSPHIGHO2_12_FULL_38_14]
MTTDDFLVELYTEELPPKSLHALSILFSNAMRERLEKASLSFDEIEAFATPRRLALLVRGLVSKQEDQVIERKGPAKAAAFDAEGMPSKACVGFARSYGVSPDELITIQNGQGEWVGLRQKIVGQPTIALLPDMIAECITTLPLPKRMRWGSGDLQFIRPIHAISMLYGSEIIDANILGFHVHRQVIGHRFLSPHEIILPHASSYAELLEKQGHVIPDFNKRLELIRSEIEQCIATTLKGKGLALIQDDLLNEVTGLVEWPVVLCGKFDDVFLDLPEEVLIAAMQDHQRYFPVVDQTGHLLSYFVIVSNIESKDPARVIHGNERVLRARLADAAFFYDVDHHTSLDQRLLQLKGIVYQDKLGTMFDKAHRLSDLTVYLADKMDLDQAVAKRAGLLAKTDLTTQMVGEFPELQGTMGYYYAKAAEEPLDLAYALKEQYLPRFAGDQIPEHPLACALAIADRLDTLVGRFATGYEPSGDKDPYGLRRAVFGLLRILIERQMNLNLNEIIPFALSRYKALLDQPSNTSRLFEFIKDRWRSFSLEQSIDADVFAAVLALEIFNPYDGHLRMLAVQSFKNREEAQSLATANKRVSHILAKYAGKLQSNAIDPKFFEHDSEQKLYDQLHKKSKQFKQLHEAGHYDEVLLQLAELRKPIDDFFDHVLVMTDDIPRRENRILLLTQLRELFLQVADIALLQ